MSYTFLRSGGRGRGSVRVGFPLERLEPRTLFAAVPDGFAYADLVTGLPECTSMAFAPDGRIFYTEKNGNVRVVKDGVVQATPVVKVSVDGYFERGLESIALDPQFGSNGIFYLYYTKRPASNPNTAPNDAKNRISRFQLNRTGNTDVVDTRVGEAVVLDGIPSDSGYHNGGAMVFDQSASVPPAQRLMYVGVGEVGLPKFDLATDRAQDLSTLAGKVLRINPRAGAQLIPSDNPFVGQAGKRGEIYSYGLRNPFTMAVKPGTNLVYANDVGSFKAEEVNEVKPGANYGFPRNEGYTTQAGFENPVHAYTHESTGHPNGQAAITGGAFYTASAFPAEYQGKYFFSDYINRFVAYFDPANPPARGALATKFATETGAIIDLDVGPDGNLYGLTHSAANNGRIVKISYAGAGVNRNPEAIASADRTSGALPLTVNFSGDGTTDPDGDTLTYAWTFGDGATAVGKDVSHTYATTGVYSARLTVTDGNGGADDSETIVIDAGNEAPVVTITLPSAGATYGGGQTIDFAGIASDPEDGDLPASAFDWKITFYHDTHTHPFLDEIDGAAGGSFTVPVDVETAANQFYRIELTVTDNAALATTTQVDVLPRTATFTLNTNVPGVMLNLDGQPVAAPASILGVAGTRRRVEAPELFAAGGVTYEFVEWSDGGARFHDISSPEVDTTYTATYRVQPPPGASIGGAVFEDLNADGVRQDSEAALAGWVVYLDQDGDGAQDPGEPSVTSGADGAFAFAELAAGSYVVREVVPAGWAVVSPAAGSHTLTLVAGQQANGTAFGNRQLPAAPPPPPPSGPGTLGARIFNDLDLDGVDDAGEPGIGRVKVYVDGNGNGRRDRTDVKATTDANGAFAFPNMPAGQYVVRYRRPGGFRPTTNAANAGAGANAVAIIDVPAGGNSAAPIGMTRTSLLQGRVIAPGLAAPPAGSTVFLDLNRNKVLDPNEPTALTDDAGQYAFTLSRGSYLLTTTALPGGGIVVAKAKVPAGRVVNRDLVSRV